MIYYFSGTGNSRFVAEQLAKYTKDSLQFIPDVLASLEGDITVAEGETIGVVFPVYAWAPPAVVMEFLAHVHLDKKAYAYAVCTCGDEAGKALDELRRVYAFKSAYSVTMPNNYIPLFDLDEPELTSEKINVATQRLPKIASEIIAKREVFDVSEGVLASFKTAVVNPLFSLFALRPSRFSVADTCTGCGACVKNCPFGTIKLADRKPVWDGRCQMCMSCIMRCPVQAIQCGSGTRRRGRYVFPAETDGPVAALADYAPPEEGGSDERAENGGSASSRAIPADSAMEFIPGASIKLFSNPGVISKQLLTPENSAGRRVTLTEVHVRPGASQPRHTHESSEQIWYAVRGSGRLLLADGKEKEFSAGNVVRFPEHTVHGLKNDGTAEFVYISVTSPSQSFAGAYANKR